ncbi:8862_t:CDS:1, partial [Funneliformis caledonium]
EGSNKRKFNLNEPYPHDTTEPQFKKRKIMGSRHHTTKDEMDILLC